ncbi:MAG TPA: Ig-like domain-containing protein, partial [Gemmatimonadaceae bacterium]|nr:Ig-like domain-containing protein [Gemmatimonadaceae bacterium]
TRARREARFLLCETVMRFSLTMVSRAICVALMVGGCEKSIVEPPLAFDVTPNAPTLFRGSSIKLDPAAMVGGIPATGPFKWSSSDTTIVRVDGTGLITGVSPGTATVRALVIDGFAETSVTVIEGGGTLRAAALTTCGINRADGALYCWGRNNEGQIGIGNQISPQPAPRKVNGGLTFTSVSNGFDLTCGMTTTGPYCWGVNSAFIINDGIVPLDSSSPTKVVRGERFNRIETNGNYSGSFTASLCIDFVCGANTCALTPEGDVFCWTASSFQPFSGATPFNPLPRVGVPRLESISVGVRQMCGIAFDKTAYCWGSSFYFSLGSGGSPLDPRVFGDGRLFQAINTGLDHTCAIDLLGDAYCLGANISGQLGAPSSESCPTRFRTTPCRSTIAKVEGGYKFLSIDAGVSSGSTTDAQPYSHTCGITTTLDIVCWGYNAYGQLGNGTTQDAATPTKVSSALKFREVTVGEYHTCAITVDGAGYCWGLNNEGQLGTGNLLSSPVPIAIGGGMTFK